MLDSNGSDGSAWLYEALDSRVLFGVGRSVEARAEVERLGGNRIMLVASPGAVRRQPQLMSMLGDGLAAHFPGVEPHCPIETVEAAHEIYLQAGADAIVTVGGGSAIGVAKNLRLRTGAVSVVIATTYSGAEMTPIYGAKSQGEKRTGRDPKAKPQTVIYDPQLTLDLPASETASTGMNGLAHCIEALYPKTANPVAAAIASEGIAAFLQGLPGSTANPLDIAARTHALRGGFIGGLLIQLVGIGLHHRICHVLGGRYDVPHGVSNSVMLPYVAHFNRNAVRAASARLRDEIDGWPGKALKRLTRQIGATQSLREVGLPRGGLREIAEESLSHEVANPRPVTVDDVERMLIQAWEGEEI